MVLRQGNIMRADSPATGDGTLPSDPVLLELCQNAIRDWVRKDIENPPDESDWRLLRRENGDGCGILILGADSVRDHCSLYVAWDDGAPAIKAISHQKPRVMFDNPWLGEDQHVRPEIDSLCCHGLFAIASELEPGADAVRFERGGAQHEIEIDPGTGRFFIVDWHSNETLAGYKAVRRNGQWVDTVTPAFPFTTDYAAESWNRASETFGRPESDRHDWIGSLFFELEDDDYGDMIFTLLNTLDAKRHRQGLASLGAGPIYGSGHWFYDRVEREPGIPPENLYEALMLERPEFLPEDVAARYFALMKQLNLKIRRD